MNTVLIVGRLAKDALVYDGEGKTPSALLNVVIDHNYVSKDGKRGTDNPEVVEFLRGGQVDRAKKYYKKGALVEIEAHLVTKPYTNKDGKKIYPLQIVADNVNPFLAAKPKSAK